ncbi:MAG: DUF4382 domain-containing protein [Halomonadaceae bacterium]|nr:MAG: DUF4382 domain-containing protein [Halomonadaceae bacterium]
MHNLLLKPLTVAIMATALAGCLSSGSSSDGTGTLSLDVTDAPVDNLSEVWITFTGVTLKPAGSGQIRIDFDEPKTLNLLDLTRGNSASLLENHEVPAGAYNFIRLHLSPNESFPDMYVVEKSSEGTPSLTVPSGQLRLVSGFTVPQGGSANFTIDFDMRKAIVNPAAQQQNYKLRPALRLINNVEVGAVAGDVFQELAVARCEEATDYAGLVYVYEGAGRTPVSFYMDEEGEDLREEQPLMAVNVEMLGSDSDYSYKAAFLKEGDYTIAYTCDEDDMAEDDALDFTAPRTVTIEANTTRQEDFGTHSE